MKKILTSFLTMSLIASGPLAVTSCQQKTTYLFGGSTSVQGLMQSMLDKFNKENNLRIAYNSSGSSGGESGIKNDTLIMGFTSRNLNTEFTAVPYAGLKFAIDGILIIANLPSTCNLSANELDIKENKISVLKQIYEGTLKTWGELLSCSSTSPVIPINREQNSGTRDVFGEKLGVTEFSSQLRTVNNTAAAIQEVKNISGAISYVSYSAKKIVQEVNLTFLKYKGIEPSTETLSNSYDLKRYFELTFRYENNKNINLINNFLLFLKNSEKGKKSIIADELIPVWEWYEKNPFQDLEELN